MKHQDNVFLLTLIDFLFQIIFFGLFIYVAYSAQEDPSFRSAVKELQQKFGLTSGTKVTEAMKQLPSSLSDLQDSARELPKLKKAQERLGFSNLTELTDELTRMAPIREVKAATELSKAVGGAANAEALAALVKTAGGIDGAKEAIGRYVKEGVGKPHCLPQIDAQGKVTGARPLATVKAYEDVIVFEALTPELSSVLKALGYDYAAIHTLPLRGFDERFRQMARVLPDCIHSINFVEMTRFVEPRDAARRHFRLAIRKGIP